MTTFDERERAFEARFALDFELQFRAEARRNRLVGEWAAGLLGKTGDAVHDYAMTVVNADLHKPGTQDIVAKLVADLGGKVTADEVRAKLAEMMPEAKRQLLDDAWERAKQSETAPAHLPRPVGST